MRHDLNSGRRPGGEEDRARQATARIGVVGIPVYVGPHFRQAVFVPGATDALRAHLVAKLCTDSRAGPDVATDLGELPGWIVRGRAPVWVDSNYDSCFAPLGLRIRKFLEEYDGLVVVGGSHQAAFATYFVDGTVLRLDQHSDDETDLRWGVDSGIHSGNYVLRAYEHGLKQPGDVVHWRVPLNVHAIPWAEMRPRYFEPFADCGASIFDIDIASLDSAYGALSHYGQPCCGFHTLEDIARMIELNRPKLIGLYEYFPQFDAEGRVSQVLGRIASNWLDMVFPTTSEVIAVQ